MWYQRSLPGSPHSRTPQPNFLSLARADVHTMDEGAHDNTSDQTPKVAMS